MAAHMRMGGDWPDRQPHPKGVRRLCFRGVSGPDRQAVHQIRITQLRFCKWVSSRLIGAISGRSFAAVLLAAVIGFVFWSYTQDGIVSLLLRNDIPASVKLDGLQAYFLSWGRAAPLVYMIIVTVEVIVAPIPGAMLYAPGGVIFGGGMGGTMSLLGNVLGAGISCQITRVLGRGFVESHLKKDTLDKYERVLDRRGVWIISLLRVNPLTSSDLVSYAAGLISVPVWKVMVGTLFGMAPLCYFQAYFARELFEAFPFLIYPFLGLCAGYAAIMIWILMKAKREPTRSGTGGI